MLAWLSQWHFAQPLWWYAIPVCLLLLALVLWRWPQALASPSALLLYLSRRAYRHPQFSELMALHRLKQGSQAARHWRVQFFGYAVLLSLLLTALAQPYRLGKRLPEPEHHRDIVFIVDTSLDMVLRDYEVDGQRIQRMTMLKDVMQQFIQALHGNRIGLVVFSEQPYYYVPLTRDYALLQYQLQRLEPAVLTGRSNNISRALLYTLHQLQGSAPEQAGAKPELVLISDANRTARHIDPRAAARFVAEHHLRLHTIAIGAGSYAAEDKQHTSLIYHPASFYLLQGIASAGNGKFFWARDRQSLQQALQVINQAELHTTRAAPQYLQQPFYMWPLLLALLWLSLWQFAGMLRWRS